MEGLRPLLVVPIGQFRIVDQVFGRIELRDLGASWLMGPQAILITLLLILTIEVVITQRIHYERNLVESSFTFLCECRSIDRRNIPFESSNQIGTPLSLDFGPLGIA